MSYNYTQMEAYKSGSAETNGAAGVTLLVFDYPSERFYRPPDGFNDRIVAYVLKLRYFPVCQTIIITQP
jgi:hypothetical protein